MKFFFNEKFAREYGSVTTAYVQQQLTDTPVDFTTFVTPPNQNFGFDEPLKFLNRLAKNHSDEPHVYIAHTTLYLTDTYLGGVILFYTHGELRRFVLGILTPQYAHSTLQDLLSNILTPQSS